MTSDYQNAQHPNLHRNVKDDVFCDMFSRKEYLLELYKDLHPEDKDVTEDDLELVTIERVVASGLYNDLGFVARDRLVILVEAQSTWSPNITTRMLLYLAETNKELIQKNDTSLHTLRAVPLPAPELFVVYTGSKSAPATVSFKDDILGGAQSDLNLTVHVITNSDGIVGQYVGFSQAVNELSSKDYSPASKARLLLDTCIERGILRKYLKTRYKEVEGIMFTLFDQEEVTRHYMKEIEEIATAEGMAKGMAKGMAEGVAKGMAEGVAKGMAEGIAAGRAEERIEIVKALMSSQGISATEAMGMIGIDENERPAILTVLESGQEG